MSAKFAGLLTGAICIALSGTASAADLPVKARALPAPVAAFSWTGFYLGGNAGYAWGDTNVVYTAPGDPNGFIPIDVATYSAGATQRIGYHGFTGGVQAGYNWQINNFLLGVEGDVNYLSRSGSFVGTFPQVWGVQNVNISTQDSWLATIRGRAGLTFNQVLIYVTGGAAFTNASVNIGNNWNPALDFRDASGTVSATAGWVAGGGVEYAVLPNWSVKAEYLRVQFNKETETVFTAGMLNPGAPVAHRYDVTFSDNIVRVGVNYHFGGPVVAKY